jgi:hypothetical protein
MTKINQEWIQTKIMGGGRFLTDTHDIDKIKNINFDIVV